MLLGLVKRVTGGKTSPLVVFSTHFSNLFFRTNHRLDYFFTVLNTCGNILCPKVMSEKLNPSCVTSRLPLRKKCYQGTKYIHNEQYIYYLFNSTGQIRMNNYD